VEDDRRRLVEPLSVVKNHHGGPAGREGGDAGSGLQERGHAVARQLARRQQASEGAERDAGSRLAGDQAHGRPAGGFELSGDRRGEAGLADSRGSRQECAPTAAQQRPEVGDLGVPPAQGPGGPHQGQASQAIGSAATEHRVAQAIDRRDHLIDERR
jgi:hypothetical protein